MPYISGASAIDLKAIQIPSNQYFMKNFFKDIIEFFLENKSFPGEQKCGLVYLFNQEWIYYTIEELFYQKYISHCNKILSLAYEDFRNYKLEPDTLFTEKDKYILPSSVRGYATKFLQESKELKASPDLLIKLKQKNYRDKNYDKLKEGTFEE